MFRHILQSVLCGGFLVALAPFALAQENARAKAPELADALLALADDVPARLYDVDALAEALDYNVKAAAAFVRDEVAYDPYVGVMRGPKGTILAQAGSVWDQAVLTAALINAMGGEAMLVRGEINERDTAALLMQTFAHRPDIRPLDINGQLSAVLAKYGYPANTETQAVIPEEQPAVRQATETLAGLVGADAKTAEFLKGHAKYIASSYVWVQYRDTPNDPWIEVHPAFGSAPHPQPAPERYISASVPEEMLHQVKVEVLARLRDGDEIRDVALMRPYVRPAANLLHQQIILDIVPGGLSEAGKVATYIYPSLYSTMAPGAKAVTASGLVVDAAEVNAGPGVFGALANSLSKSSEGLGGDGFPVAGIDMKVTLISPGAPDRTERRVLGSFDDDNRDLGSAAQKISIQTDTGPMSMADRFVGITRHMSETMTALSSVRSDQVSGIGAEFFAAVTQNLPLRMWYSGLLATSEFQRPANQDGVAVRVRPFVFMERASQPQEGPPDRYRSVIDIVSNDTIVLKDQGGEIMVDPEATLSVGVRDSYVEGLFGTSLPMWSEDLANFQLITSSTELDGFTAQMASSDEAKARLLADFDNTGAVVVPDALNEPLTHWWRLDPGTGTVLRMNQHGGAVATESEITRAGIAISTIFAIKGAVGCNTSYEAGSNSWYCCQAANGVLAATGIGIGKGVSFLKAAWLSGYGAFAFGLSVDVTADAAGSAIDAGLCRGL